MRVWRKLVWVAAAWLCTMPAQRARAAVMVLVGEPFGSFGTMLPVGHTAVFLNRVCADGPVRLRMCAADEPQGVVISRYHGIGRGLPGGLDWMASPVMVFLYATERVEDVPRFVTEATAWEMRQEYRRRYLSVLVPDGTENLKGNDEWWESAGMAFNRRLWGYELATTREQDEQLVAAMNARPNVFGYHFRKANCANFAADVVNFYFPGTVEVDKVADWGLMTPKQVARRVTGYGQKHAETGFRVVEVPQVPGTLRRSRPVRGSSETFLKTKRYLATMLVLQPEAVATDAVLYLARGRWKVGEGAEVVGPEEFAGRSAVGVGEGGSAGH